MSVTSRQGVRVLVAPLAAVDTAGGVFAWRVADDGALPADARIAILKVVVDVTTKASAACTLDIGIAANGATSNDTLIDGVDVGTAAGVFDNTTNKGTNGLPTRMATIGQFITASVASGASAGIVGSIVITYTPVAMSN